MLPTIFYRFLNRLLNDFYRFFIICSNITLTVFIVTIFV